MLNLLDTAQALVSMLLSLMPSRYQQRSLRALLGLFWEATGQSVPEHSVTVSPSALSRFLNRYAWPTRTVIRSVRAAVLARLLRARPPGRRPVLHVIVDLTCLPKVGSFLGLGSLVRRYNGQWGLHLVVLFLVVNPYRVPWSFRVYRGRGEASPIQLAQRLIASLPRSLKQHDTLRVLGDTAFGSIEMLRWVKTHPRCQGIFGIRHDRRLADGRHVSQIRSRGQQVWLQGLEHPVTLSWYWLRWEDGSRHQRFVVSTHPLSGSYITRLGRRRWQIEGFFKTVKHRFGLHHFGQATRLGVYRWFVLCWIAYLLAHWAFLYTQAPGLPDWGAASRLVLEACLPLLVTHRLLLEIDRLEPLVRSQGFNITVETWRYG